MLLRALFRLAFASAPRLYRLTSQHNVTRRPVLQKVRHHTRAVLCLLVSTRFQVLFHSPPGVLFTFPSRYYSLSVTWSYLAFGDGPPFFRQDFSCPDVLRIPLTLKQFRLRGCYPLRLGFPTVFGYRSWCRDGVLTPHVLLHAVWAPPISLATTFGIVLTFFSSGMFQFPGFPSCNYGFIARYCNITCSAFPHSDICGSLLICSSPQLFAACHVLPRRHVPRHPPYALCSLIVLVYFPYIQNSKFQLG